MGKIEVGPLLVALFICVLALGGSYVWAQTIPANARLYLPILVGEQRSYWPNHYQPETLAGTVEQETCISLKHQGCWNPRTELKTSREYGFGLGQATVTSSFNTFDESKKLDPSLKSWQWSDRYDPKMQLRALILKEKQGYNLIKESATDADHLAFTYAAYNGGVGGVLSDRRICRATKDCDATKWFGHVEKTSLKARAVSSGYGKSFFEINREYVRNIMLLRSQKYQPFFRNPP